MIARTWTGEATPENAGDYEEHLRTSVIPALRTIEGYRDVFVLRRPLANGGFEYLVMTTWDSMESIRGFAGDDVETAVVPDEAQRVLRRFDDTVKHYERVEL